jgi:transaldolase
LLTIAPNFLDELSTAQAALPRKLDPEKARTMAIERIPMDEATFRRMHAADAMAKDKLEEGIEGFTKAIITLEKALSDRLA